MPLKKRPLDRDRGVLRDASLIVIASEDTYAMQAAFEPKWEGGVPFTMVVAPGGKVLYQKQGEMDILEVRRVILANLENETYVGHPSYWAQ